tara:strand:+ start:235 stop:507 length:273 start_codon:yes stop_codon:yes gene_type:complete
LKLPYKQLKIGHTIFRLFYKKEDRNLYYKWHTDENSRNVWFLPFGKWQIQFDDDLPEKINPKGIYWIPKGLYHRLIRKSGILLCVIFEKD